MKMNRKNIKKEDFLHKEIFLNLYYLLLKKLYIKTLKQGHKVLNGKTGLREVIKITMELISIFLNGMTLKENTEGADLPKLPYGDRL